MRTLFLFCCCFVLRKRIPELEVQNRNILHRHLVEGSRGGESDVGEVWTAMGETWPDFPKRGEAGEVDGGKLETFGEKTTANALYRARKS